MFFFKFWLSWFWLIATSMSLLKGFWRLVLLPKELVLYMLVWLTSTWWLGSFLKLTSTEVSFSLSTYSLMLFLTGVRERRFGILLTDNLLVALTDSWIRAVELYLVPNLCWPLEVEETLGILETNSFLEFVSDLKVRGLSAFLAGLIGLAYFWIGLRLLCCAFGLANEVIWDTKALSGASKI